MSLSLPGAIAERLARTRPRSRLVRSTAFRLTLLYVLVFAVLAVAALGYVAWNAQRLIEQQIRQTIEAEITGLSEQFRQGGIRRLVNVIEQRARQPGAALYLVTTPFGERLAGNVEQVPVGLLDRPGESEIPFARSSDEGQQTRPGRAIVRVYVLPAGFRVLVGRDASERDRLRAVVLNAGGWAIGVVMLLVVVGGFVIARRILSRVDAMSETAETILASDLKERLPVSGAGDELDRLATNLNGMLDRIGVLMGGLRQVSDNIAHDLKTPLTRLRNRADSALRADSSPEDLRKALEGITEDADNLIRVFNALLMIARLEAGQMRETLGPFDLSEVVADVAELYGPVTEEGGGVLTVEAPETAPVIGNRDLIGQALANLVDNALKYGQSPDGTARITVGLRREGDRVAISVADRGAGIAPEERAKALERFGRLDASRTRPGFGLGLSLVSAVARIHDSTLTLADNGPGLIASFSVRTAGEGQ